MPRAPSGQVMRPGVFIDQTEDGVAPLQLCRHGITGWWWRVRREWSLLTQRTVRPVTVAMGDVFGEYGLEISMSEDQHPVEALATHSPYEELGERIGPWSSDRGADDPDTFSLEDLVEARGELGIFVADQEPDGMNSVVQQHGQVSRMLHYPCRSDER